MTLAGVALLLTKAPLQWPLTSPTGGRGFLNIVFRPLGWNGGIPHPPNVTFEEGHLKYHGPLDYFHADRAVVDAGVVSHASNMIPTGYGLLYPWLWVWDYGKISWKTNGPSWNQRRVLRDEIASIREAIAEDYQAQYGNCYPVPEGYFQKYKAGSGYIVRVRWGDFFGDLGVVLIGVFGITTVRRTIDVVKEMRAVKLGHCPACNYNLAGLVRSRCPECGTPVPTATFDERGG